MSFSVEVFPSDEYAQKAAERIAAALPSTGAVVLTGGTTAEKVYGPLARVSTDWSHLDVFFSDERCVPPDDDASNFKMADRLLLGSLEIPERVHRMRGEDDPEAAAISYHAEVSSFTGALNLMLLGMGADAHIAAIFPGSPALEAHQMCIPVDRPDGLKGLTLTPPALEGAAKILLIVAGEGKAEAVRRAVGGNEPPEACPARLLADHPDATFLLDEDAAALL